MLDETLKSCLPCGLHVPVRNYYFDGKLLVARDFTDEQDYHRGLRHLHNQMLHGTGTVCGLKVIQHPQESCRRENLVIEPGMALDCCGQELILAARRRVDVAAMLEADPDLAEALDGSRHLLVALRRCDKGAEPMPLLLPGCGEADATEYGRVLEDVEVVLLAIDPAAEAAASVPQSPRLDWVHTMTFGAQVPKSLHVNEVEQRLQVAVDTRGGSSHGYVFVSDTDEAAQTHDLAALLEGPEQLNDTQSSRETGLVFFAGRNWSFAGGRHGIGVWRAGLVASEAAPAALIPTDGGFQRLAVSPVSGALFVLEARGAGRARLLSYGAEALSSWLAGAPSPGEGPEPQAEMEFDHGFGAADSPFRRGASMMKVSPDGRFLAVAGGVGPADQRLYIVDIAAFNGGSVTPESARPGGFAIPAVERLMALDWSLDGSYLHILSQAPAAGGTVFLRRYALTGDGIALERAGQGVRLAGSALDLAVAPTETRAYLLLADGDGATRLTHLDMETVISVSGSEPQEVALAADALRIDGAGRALRLTGNGRRLYLAAADADEAAPDRGLVAVIDIAESDCGAHFWDPLDGCPGCAEEEDHAVLLAHLPNYVAAEQPVMADPDQAGETDVAIDNRTYRTMVPSAATLREVVDCILAQGVAEGPPGPRGNPGADGAEGPQGDDGLSIDAVEIEMLEPGAPPQGQTVPNGDGDALVLQLRLPSAADGTDGAGIDGATIEYVPGLEAPRVEIVTGDGGRILDIDLPPPPAAPSQPAEVNPITGLSWLHAKEHPDGMAFFGNMRETGLAVAFERPVAWAQFGEFGGKPGRSMLVELQREVPIGSGTGTAVWAGLTYVVVDPIDYDDSAIGGDGHLTAWTRLPPDVPACRGFQIRHQPETQVEVAFRPGETLRVVFHADFVLDESGRPVDGSFLGARLPTGKGAPGDTFRSWFAVPGDRDTV